MILKSVKLVSMVRTLKFQNIDDSERLNNRLENRNREKFYF